VSGTGNGEASAEERDDLLRNDHPLRNDTDDHELGDIDERD
jgi:hypothetical protein